MLDAGLFKRALVSALAIVSATSAGVVGGMSHASAAGESDYFVEAFGDPMDFSNNEDLVTNVVDEAMFVGATNKSISDGQLRFDSSKSFAFDMVWPGFPTGIPHGREGGRVPIDASKYQRVVFRMNAPEGSSFGLRWYNCLKQSTCEGGQGIAAQPGWATYDIKLGENTEPSLPVAWSGKMTGLRLVGNVNGHVDVDWIRLVPADAQNVGEITGGPTVNIAPVDKLDFATAAGNPWDMDSMADVSEQVALKPGSTVANNMFSGCSIGTATGQFPGLVFNMQGKLIDADRFKTLTFEYSYDGPFSARPVPGAGTFARVFWFDTAGNRHPTNAIHLYPNEKIVQIRLDDPATMFQGIEPGKGKATGAPWAGKVTSFRINPNDTKDSKCFKIGRVWLTSDDPAGTKIELPVGKPAGAAKPSAAIAAKTTAPKKASAKPVVKVVANK